MFLFSKPRGVLLAAGSALAMLAAAGCSHDDNPPPAVNTTTTVTAPATVPGTVTTTPGTTVVAPGTTVVGHSTNNTNAGAGGATGTDTTTADAVNKAIHNNAQMTGSRVTAVVQSGVARLTGTAQNQQQKGLAETTARQTSGVSSVVNKIEIVPTGGVKSASPKPVVQTKIKTVVVHDKVLVPVPSKPANSDTSTSDTTTGTTTTDSNGNSTTAPTTNNSANNSNNTKGQ